MKKQTNTVPQKKLPITICIIALFAVVLSGITGYSLAFSRFNNAGAPTRSTPGYVTEEDARDQVNGFYQQYLNPREDIPQKSRRAYIDSYGTKNLVFYSEYYQHGFDPIVCSTVMPTSVVAKNAQPGPGALVTAEAKFPDGSIETINLTLVLNHEGFGIDSITCSDDKGNLPPSRLGLQGN